MPGENGKSKSATVKSAKRREELRRTLRKPGIDVRSLFLRRDLVTTLLVFLLFFLGAGALTIFSHGQLKIVPDQIMTETRVKRLDFEVVNEALTEQERERARDRAPHVFRPNLAYLDELRTALLRLPVAVESKAVNEVAPELIEQFELNQERLQLVQSHVKEGEITEEWRQWVTEDLMEEAIPQNPTLSREDFQVEQVRSELPEFITDGRPRRLRGAETKVQRTQENLTWWRRNVVQAGIPEAVAGVMASRLLWNAQPTYQADPVATRARAEQAAARVRDRTVTHKAGEVIFRAGDRLTTEQFALSDREAAEYAQRVPAVSRWYQRLGVFGVVGLVAAFLAGYLIRFYPRVVHNPLRAMSIAALCLAMLAIAIWIAVTAPPFIFLVAVPATLFVAVILVIAYDQRVAVTVAGLQCALTTFALEQSLAFFVLLLATNGTAIAALREVRHRNALVGAAGLAALVAGVGAIVLGVFETPMYDGAMENIAGAWKQIFSRAGLAAIGSLGVGFLLLGILPSVERLFDMTTGMTLVELRDPRQPLLRQLQERAPGTYNHSLQVANIAEAAADAIGADPLLTYVGALYHDIGKMNKPGYFVENQSDGANKHAKLSPAMSLLVIIGHVKDGIELAREYNLPRSIIHFIESHHGTTLVEYFYHAAKSKAEQEGEGEKVTELEFRYPGPKPRSKEAAILMIADATESATRAMEEPGPAAIENLVRKLSRKRLKDGQFDESDITLRELTTVEDSIIKSVWALHHGRIAYPKGEAAQEQVAPRSAAKVSPQAAAIPARPA